MYVTTCGKCQAQYSWAGSSVPDCPRCGYNHHKGVQQKRQVFNVAAQAGDLGKVQAFLKDEDIRVNINAGFWTALHSSVFGGHLEVARCLLSHGANPNTSYPQTDSETPLHSAAARKRYEIAALLMDHGADANLKDKHGKTAFDVARESQDELMHEVLEEGKKRQAAQAVRRAEELKIEEAERVKKIEELRKRQEEELKRNAERYKEEASLLAAEQERKAEQEARERVEEARRKSIKEARKVQGECVLCGEPLGFLQKSLRQDKHFCCTSFQDDQPEKPRNTDGKGADSERIRFQCPKCKRPYRVNLPLAGKRGKCPGCGKVILIPATQPASWLDTDLSGKQKSDPLLNNKYRRRSFYWGIPGLILMLLGNIFFQLLNSPGVGVLGILIGDAFLFRAFFLYAISKGRSPALCFLALLPVIGLIVLPCLEEEEQQNHRLNEADRLRKKEALEHRDGERERIAAIEAAECRDRNF